MFFSSSSETLWEKVNELGIQILGESGRTWQGDTVLKYMPRAKAFHFCRRGFSAIPAQLQNWLGESLIVGLSEQMPQPND